MPGGVARAIPGARSAITRVSICGYKSLSKLVSLEIAPLTILAGANSSGKSSAMQPLLLFKQTLEESVDPGPLKIFGPHVKFTRADQMMSKGRQGRAEELRVKVEATSAGEYRSVECAFRRVDQGTPSLEWTEFASPGFHARLRNDMSHEEVMAQLSAAPPRDIQKFTRELIDKEGMRWSVKRYGCFHHATLSKPRGKDPFQLGIGPVNEFSGLIREILHLPGLRGNPTRTYPMAAVGRYFSGTFEPYTASIISHWRADKRTAILKKLNRHLQRLGLTSMVEAALVDDTQIELKVAHKNGTRGKRATDELINIADVGFGVSQVLPILVAVHEADSARLVYIEQPEIHLHPRAQVALAEVLAEAAERGVRLVVETHSATMLLAFQALVAEGKLAPEKTRLHWFECVNGVTKVSSQQLSERGSFGDWPADFGSVEMSLESRYLDAAQRGRSGNGSGSKDAKAPRGGRISRKSRGG